MTDHVRPILGGASSNPQTIQVEQPHIIQVWIENNRRYGLSEKGLIYEQDFDTYLWELDTPS